MAISGTNNKLPLATKTLLFSCCTATLIWNIGKYFREDLHHWLKSTMTFVPGELIAHPWALISATLFEDSVILLFLNAPIIYTAGNYLEIAWRTKYFCEFIMLTNILDYLFVFNVYFVKYVFRNDTGFLYERHAQGLSGIAAAFLVALKQHIPHYVLPLWFTSDFSIRFNNLPFVYVISQALFTPFIGSGVYFYMSVLGLAVSWVYLRFFKVQEGIRGDRSETFSFASFFPEKIQPPVKFVSNAVYRVLVALRCCDPIGSLTLPVHRTQVELSDRFDHTDVDPHAADEHVVTGEHDELVWENASVSDEDDVESHRENLPQSFSTASSKLKLKSKEN